MTDFLKYVPRELGANLEYRIALRKRAVKDVGFRSALMEASRHDILFWLNAFCFLHEPRAILDAQGRELPHVIPFITRPRQDEVIPILRKELGHRDIGLEKARGWGASWVVGLLALHDWLFRRDVTIGLCSSSEDKADKPGDRGSMLGKSLAFGTPVLTPDGWVPIETLRPGACVIGSDGRPTRVLRVLEPYRAPLWRMRFADGTAIDCTEDHRWPMLSYLDRRRQRRGSHVPYKLLTPLEMAGDLHHSRHWKWWSHETVAVDLPDKRLPIDPYVLGVLLGDGCLCKTGVEFASVDDDVVAAVRARLGPEFVVRKSGRCVWFISLLENNGHHTPNPISESLTSLGLRGKRAWEKHIPTEYLVAGEQQRLALLRGLMDTDGTVQLRSGTPMLTTTSQRLADDIRRLVASLGGQTRMTEKFPKYRHNGEVRQGRKAYVLCISLAHFNPFLMRRKAEAVTPRSQTTSRALVSVEPIGEGWAQCIQVAADDGLFVTTHGIVTHNCDWELEMLPEWMVGKPKVDWRRHRSDHLLEHFRNRTVIVSSASTGKTGRGHRFLWFGLDELSEWDHEPAEAVMASLQHTTNSRLFVGTPLGTEGVYYDIMHKNTSMRKIELDWKDDPSRNRGLYKFDGPMPKALDPVGNPLPKHYDPPTPEVFEMFARLRANGFRLDDTTRSPWYDAECDRANATPQKIAQELDRDYGGSQYRIFGHSITQIVEGTVRAPKHKGMLDFHVDTLEPAWEGSERGPMLVWSPLFDGRPPHGVYIAGADVSAGLGGLYTSNSVLVILNHQTGDQVLELATNTMEPGRFADVCMSACKWFHNAYLAWEINGPGAAMTRRVVERGYANVYMREAWQYRTRKKQPAMGWHTSKDTKEVMFDALKQHLRTGRVAIRSSFLADECQQYVLKKGKIVPLAAQSADDSSAGEAHGDRVIALGVAIQAMRDRVTQPIETGENPQLHPMYTEAGRMREYELELERVDDFDARTNWDLVA